MEDFSKIIRTPRAVVHVVFDSQNENSIVDFSIHELEKMLLEDLFQVERGFLMI